MKKELKFSLWIVLLSFLSLTVTFILVLNILDLADILNDIHSPSFLRTYNILYFIFIELIIGPLVLISCSLLCKKHTILLIPLSLILLSHVISLFIGIISYAEEFGISWEQIISLILYLGSSVVSIIAFISSKPLSKKTTVLAEGEICNDALTKESSKEMPVSNGKAISLDDLFKAKELLDEGAITQEEFNEIKRRVIR